jgi:hypothetical protein
MRYLPILLLLIMISSSLYSQSNKGKDGAPWSDTSFKPVVLKNKAYSKKIIVMEMSDKATIYLELNRVRQELNKKANDFVTSRNQQISSFLDSATAKSDTVILYGYYDPPVLYLLSHLLQAGHAAVYDLCTKTFVKTIYHRLERVVRYAYRNFYLPDKQRFYSVQEYSGILDPDEIE